jgi:hypothetical protein
VPLRITRDFGWPAVYPRDTLITMKDSGLRIRVERDLRDRFLELCREHDRPAAQVLRQFMREYIEKAQDRPGKARERKREKT